MTLRLASHQGLQDPILENSMMDVLDILEERHQIVRESWEQVVRTLPDDCLDDLTQQTIVMETELARYRRYLALLRDRMLRQQEQCLLGL